MSRTSSSGPDPRENEARRAALSRDAGRGRLRRLTRASIAATALLGGAFAAMAAGSTPAKRAAATQASAPAGRAGVLVQAPAPPLVAVQSAAPPAPAPPAAAPAPAAAPPVVVSGGS